ncbi:AAA family ATPase [uncultured Duodenibacillus sp.]|uniref:AAA family ATPase n=1 Tax=uncultured Duodenibacillus sp. TaxID=1980699 RepID=UPI002805F3B6|nr:AAA family ATPase [uncultured Duodenibacillus sp.]
MAKRQNQAPRPRKAEGLPSSPHKPLMARRASDLLSCWVGATEQNIARAFEEARKDDAVLLIDEADSFLQDRRGAGHSWELNNPRLKARGFLTRCRLSRNRQGF